MGYRDRPRRVHGTVLTLSVIGAGRVGRTLCRLLHRNGLFAIGDVLNRTAESAEAAASFIGAGRPTEDWSRLGHADLYMLSVPDDAIEVCVGRLRSTGVVRRGSIVFHVSGSKPSSVLAPLADDGARIASLHPVKSFADPGRAAETFAGTACALEGDAEACAVLGPAIERCGGRVFRIDSKQKLVYHAATVFASNYAVALIDVALRCFERADVDRERAFSIALPLIRGTVENVARLGTVDALTGPIARGDAALVDEQLRALEAWDPRVAALYAELGLYALELSRRQGSADGAALERIAARLRDAAGKP